MEPPDIEAVYLWAGCKQRGMANYLFVFVCIWRQLADQYWRQINARLNGPWVDPTRQFFWSHSNSLSHWSPVFICTSTSLSLPCVQCRNDSQGVQGAYLDQKCYWHFVQHKLFIAMGQGTTSDVALKYRKITILNMVDETWCEETSM